MTYPLISEYIEAIKFPEDNFKELSYLRPVLDKDGQPIMSSGNFAVVFKMKDCKEGKFYAIKCYTKEQEGRAERYRLITKELKYISSNYITNIRYLDHELFVDSKVSDEDEQPILLMDWVEGKTLDIYIRDNINNRFLLSILSLEFRKMAIWLLSQPFAHGDLKPENIIVKRNKTMVIVDYDGMFVPSMKGRFIANEIGSPGFRHPDRTHNDFDKYIDDFSIASIMLSLKAIAFLPSLYTTQAGNDKLLFSESDYKDLNKSEIIKLLQPLTRFQEFCFYYGIFMIAWANKKLDSTLFNLSETHIYNNIPPFIGGEDEYCAGIQYIDQHEYEEAFNIFREIAIVEDRLITSFDIGPWSLAQNGLGYMYANGLWVEKDYKQAVTWFKISMQNGNDIGLFNLGVCYYNGWGVEKDEEKANILFHQAALKKVGPALDLESWMVCLGVSAKEELSMNISKQKEITSTFIL